MKKSIKKNIVTAIPDAILLGILHVISGDIPFSSPSFWPRLIQYFLIFSITYLMVGALFDYFFGNEK